MLRKPNMSTSQLHDMSTSRFHGVCDSWTSGEMLSKQAILSFATHKGFGVVRTIKQMYYDITAASCYVRRVN
jgi:hypothetical protein